MKNSEALLKVQARVDAQKQLGKPVLAFCIYRESRMPDEYFRQIYKEIKEDFSILTLSGLEPSLFAMPGEVLPLPVDELALVRGVDIFIVIDEYLYDFPDTSLVAAFPHSFLGYSTQLSFDSWKYKQCYYDAYFTTTPRTLCDASLIRKAHDLRCNPQRLRRKRREFLFIPVGCPRVASVQRALAECSCEQDSILYAPTGYWNNPGEIYNCMIGKYGINLVGDLLETFPHYRIVFRPCVSSWEHKDVKALIAAHAGHPRFAVSRDFDHTPEFARAATLVTEYSNIGEVFALASLRPEVRSCLEHPKDKEIRLRTGMGAHPEGDVMRAVRAALDAPEFWKKHIAQSYDCYIYSPQSTFARIRAALLDLAAKRIPRNSVAVQRDWKGAAWTEMEYLRHIFEIPGMDRELIGMFRADFPEDPVSFCLYLLMMRKSSPSYFILHEIGREKGEKLRKLTGFVIDAETLFSEIPVDICRTLLKQGKLKAAKEHNPTYSSFIDILLNSIDALL